VKIRMMMEFSDVTRAAAAASSSRHRRSRLSRVCDVPTNIARLGHRLIVSHMSTPRARFRRLLRSCVTRHRVQETSNEEREVEFQNNAQQEEQRVIESTEDEQDVAHKEEEEEEEIIEHKEEEIEEKEEEETPPTTRPDYLTRLRNAIRAGQQDIALALAYESPPTLRNNEIVRALLNSDWFGAVYSATPESERLGTMPTVTFLSTISNTSDNVDVGRSILNAINAGSILQHEVRSILSIDLSEILSHSSPLDLIEMRLNGSAYGSRPVSSDTLKKLKQYSFCADHDCAMSCTICMETFSKSQKVIELPCNHVFHSGCISKWFEAKNTCPNCRLVIDDERSTC